MPLFVRAVFGPLFGLLLAIVSAPLTAEVVEQQERHFITRDKVVVKADLKTTWLALIQPSTWWNSLHTWSGDAANLSLTPQGGGCFCERIPEVDEPGRFTLEGSVEHMRVIQAYPEQSLRMLGALGPLQSEPVTGVLTIAMSEIKTATGTATRIVWEYNVGGPMRYDVAVISKAVDGVMSLQLAGLAKLLGVVESKTQSPPGAKAGAASNPAASASAADKPAANAPAKPAAPAPQPVTRAPPPAGATSAPQPALKPEPQPEPKPAPKRETVDEAFEDFKGDGSR